MSECRYEQKAALRGQRAANASRDPLTESFEPFRVDQRNHLIATCNSRMPFCCEGFAGRCMQEMAGETGVFVAAVTVRGHQCA